MNEASTGGFKGLQTPPRATWSATCLAGGNKSLRGWRVKNKEVSQVNTEPFMVGI